MSHSLRVDGMVLRRAGRRPEVPFELLLSDGRTLFMRRLLRVLPGKRIVGEATLDGQKVLAKLFIAQRSIRHWNQERRGIDALRAAHVPTPDLVAAMPLAGGGYALLTSFLEDSESFAEAWSAVAHRPAGDAQAVAVLAPAMALVGRMHACGLIQNDLHLGNFLRCAGRLYVIDGDAVRAVSAGTPLCRKQAARNMAVLLAQLPQSWDAHWSLLLSFYAEHFGGDLDAQLLQTQVLAIRRWRLKDYLRKSVRECTLFSVTPCFSRFVAVRRDVADVLATALENPDLTMSRGMLLKDGGTCTVVQVSVAGRELVIKRYNLKGLWHAALRACRPSRAWQSWREAHRLLFLGIPTPAPLALIEERFWLFRRRAWLVSDYCPGVNLRNHLDAEREPPKAEAEALRQLFQSLCDNQLSHGDMKASNLLWHDGRVVLIDLDAMRQHRLPGAWQRAWQRDRARLLRNWPVSSALHRWLDSTLPQVP